ncbi:hypothetical protein VTN31DRAFT_1145 [Thermomyces dupontii]|uniref:uncharacterized protein n=1 Tax=Talaromyces thermophilus TaxID=28565 RepID=UPI0037440508
MHQLHSRAAASLSLPPRSYIYSLVASPSSPGKHLAATASDDSLRVFDRETLRLVSTPSTKAHSGVTSLKEYRDVNGSGYLATAGRDGAVRLWDIRAKGGAAPAVELSTENGRAILSLECDPATNTIVSGTELAQSQAVVALWDVRSPKQPKREFIESHNDDVTELQFHPTRRHVLLSGSTDGLVNIYDTTIADEDDVLLQVINHGSIHRAGFLSDNTVYALSHDEVFSIHPVTDPDSESTANDPSPIHFGDVRQLLSCQYVVQILPSSQGSYLAAGDTSNPRLDLFPLIPATKWDIDRSTVWRLPGGHGPEIIRTVYMDEESKTLFTGAEDGFVRAWVESSASTESTAESKPKLKSEHREKKKKKQREERRYKPY